MPDSRKNLVILCVAFLSIFISLYHAVFTGQSLLGHEGTMWYGSVHYLVTSLLNGNFPYWNPDLQCGTYFYPNIPILSGLDPSVLLIVAFKYLFNLSILKGYFLFYFLRLFIFGAGLYLLYEHITKSRVSAALTAGILMLCIAPQYLRQPGALYAAFLSPIALYFVLRFLEKPDRFTAYAFLFSAVLTYGVIANIYVPAYEAFNTVFFLIVIFATGAVSLKNAAARLRDKKMLVALCGAGLLLIMLLGPGLAVYRDVSSAGELIPLQRISLKTGNSGLKKIMATDLDTSSLSQGMSNHTGAFMAAGNLACMLFPDANPTLSYFAENGLFAEMGGYIGIIPLVLGLFAVVAYRSRYKYAALVMIVLIFVNTFSFEGFGSDFNSLQKVFNAIFFPLKMIDARESFDPFLKIYMGILVSMGISLLLNHTDIIRNKYKHLLAICSIVVAAKIAVAGVFGGHFVLSSPYDGFILGQLLLFMVLIYLYGRGIATQTILHFITVAAILADLYVINQIASRSVLMEGAELHQIVSAADERARTEKFQWFREPLPGPFNMAFGESIVGIKGAMTAGVNHSPFSSRRYYDFMTHLPLSNQFALNGIVFPVIQFFPKTLVIPVQDKKDFLAYYNVDRPDAGKYVFIEKPGISYPRHAFASYDQYETAGATAPMNILRFYDEYIRQNGSYMTFLRSNPDYLLRTREYDIELLKYSGNELTIKVRNADDGYLYYSDVWSKYWEAFDNGHPVQVDIANYAFKGVFLSRGDHEIRFVFNPVPYKIGLAAYCIGFCLAVFLIIFYLLRNRKYSSLSADDQLQSPAASGKQ